MDRKIGASARRIADLVGGEVVGDESRMVFGVSSLKDAKEDNVSFVGNKKYQSQLDATKAGIVLIPRELAGSASAGRTLIVCENVDLSFSHVIMLFAPEPVVYAPGIHPSAVVDPSASIGNDVYVGPNAVIEKAVVIGDGSVIGAGCFIGQETHIGRECKLAPNVTVMPRCTLHNKVVLHAGVVIGEDGFGFIPGPGGLVKVPQTGTVVIEDDVDIGANSTVDRARFGETRIGRNTKIDNQVMIAHNVKIGQSCIIVAQAGIAGSTELGNGVILAAKAGLTGHIIVGDGTQVGGMAGVTKSLPPKSIVIGAPAEPQREFMTRVALPKKVERLNAKIEALITEVEALKARK